MIHSAPDSNPVDPETNELKAKSLVLTHCTYNVEINSKTTKNTHSKVTRMGGVWQVLVNRSSEIPLGKWLDAVVSKVRTMILQFYFRASFFIYTGQ